MKRAVDCGANGLIGSHLCHRLSKDGYYVVGLSRSKWRHGENPCDDYWCCDLRDQHFSIFQRGDCVFQLACEVGGVGYITLHENDATMLRNSTLIDLNVLDACRHYEIPQVFFASSACVYGGAKRFFAESDAYPAKPGNEFAWQKLFAERLYRSYAESYGMQVRIGRLFNTYGVGMTWEGGREKSVAALCRKIAEARAYTAIDVWGSGEQTRSFMHVDDAVEGIVRLMDTGAQTPINIGPSSEVTIRDLIKTISDIAGKTVMTRFTDGPVGVSHICSDNTIAKLALGWEPSITVEEGLKTVYPWVKEQVDKAKAA